MIRFLFLMVLLLPTAVGAQIIYALSKVKLPERIIESSGLAIQNNNLLTHNDGGSGPVIYRLDKKGVLIDSTYIKSTYNFDWEDISYNHKKLYIAETGNNLQTRKDLTVYTLDENSKLIRTTRFWYARQKSFPPPESNRDFDCEALLVRDDTAFIFTKTWSKPYRGVSYHYKFPVTADTVLSLQPIDSFATGKNNYLEGSVTGCDASPRGQYFALISCSNLYVFFGFRKNKFLQGDYAVFKFENTSQKEAIAFDSDSTFYITDERWANLVGGHLYSYNLAPYLDGRILYSDPEIIAVKTKRNNENRIAVEVESEIVADTLWIKVPYSSQILSMPMVRQKNKKFGCTLPAYPSSALHIMIFDKKRMIYSTRVHNPE